MRKMTKTALVVAAMSAMTIASASMAFAATPERKNIASEGKEVADETSAVGTWDSTKDGWTFTLTDNTKLKDTWACIDGAWYYFHDNGIMASDELVIIDDETYFFYEDGRMHAGGWLKFDADSDYILDYDVIDIKEYEDDIQNEVDGGGYDDVWMYFFENGQAADDEWVEDYYMWYYFDDVVMVCGDYDHDVDGTIYGFAADGHMYVGWEYARDDKSMIAPKGEDKVWYYYGENGKKYLGENKKNNTFYRWAEIEGKYYCFADEVNSNYSNDLLKNGGNSYGTLITKAYFNNNQVGTGNSKYYYVNDKGVMQTGVVDIPKDTRYVQGTWASANASDVKTKAITVWLDSNGQAKTGWNGDNYFTAVGTDDIAKLKTFDNTASLKPANAPQAYAPDYANNYGHLVKKAFVKKDASTLYYVDKNGDRVDNTITAVGFVTANSTAAAADGLVNGLTPWTKKSTNAGEYNAYIIHDNNGEIYIDGDVEVGRTVRVGSKKYTATAKKIAINGVDCQIFIYANEN